MSDSYPLSASHLHQQRFQLRAWIHTRLWAQVLIGLVAGIVLGTLLGPDFGLLDPATAEVVGNWLALPGQLFLGLIAMVLVPLIFTSIVQGLNGAASGTELKSVGLRLAIFIVTTTFVAAGIGAGLALWLQPGAGMAALMPSGVMAAPTETAGFSAAQAPEIIANILPTNPTASIVQGDMLAVVVLALLVGIAATQVSRERAEPFLKVLDALLSIAMVIVKWAMFLAPVAVFGLMAQLVMLIGLSSLAAMSHYVGTVLLGLALLMALYFTLAALFGGLGPVGFLKAAGGNLLLAFSTSSSSAVMPVTIETAINRLHVPENIGNLVVPLGATMNMAGTALYQSVAIIFLAQLSGIDLSTAQMVAIMVTLVASSIGAPGTPGVSIAILVSVAAAFGIPAGGMVIILGVDRFLDMSRTTVNVTGDLTACLLFRGTMVNWEATQASSD